MNDSDPRAWAVPVADPAPHPLSALRSFLASSLLMVAGLGLIGLVALGEAWYYAEAPWIEALFVPDGRLEAEGALAVVSRRVPLESAQEASPFLREILAEPNGRELADTLGLLNTEYVIAVDLEEAAFAPLLAEGRVPRAGQAELLAGPLARFETVTLDGQAFQVVGRLQGSVASLSFAYIMPRSSAFEDIFNPEAGAKEGTIVPDGASRMAELFPRAAEGEAPEGDALPLAPRALTHPGFSVTVLLGLILVGLGGAIAFHRALEGIGGRAPRWLAPLTDDVRNWPRLYRATHGLLYGIFFAGAFHAVANPGLNHQVVQFLENAFSEGDLGYIGRAYGSGNILHAAAATFLNNYVLQTLLLTLAASLPPFAFGFFKTALSFLLTGVGMAPLWLHTAIHLTYHAITMVLEFQAYILASFIALLWPLKLAHGVAHRQLRVQALQGLTSFGAAAIVTAALLAIAALYEAATLILIRF